MTSTGSTLAVNRQERIEKVQQVTRQNNWDALLVLNAADIRWLTGINSTNMAMVVNDKEAMIVTDFRYVAEAEALGTFDVRKVNQALYSDLGRVIGDLMIQGVVAYSPSAISHRSFLSLTETIPDGVTLRSSDNAVGVLRMVKDASEIEILKRASALLEPAYADVMSQGIVGRTEREVAWLLERHTRDAGAQHASFDFIVASGTNGAFAHHTPGPDVIGPGTLVTIDMGVVVDGYCSDCTRTFATGDLPDELSTIYDVTLRAQKAALAAVGPGAVCSHLDSIARDIIDAAGYGDKFGHSLGHGVGIDIHEEPRLSQHSNVVLEPGMVVTVEPGIYLPGVGGVRIEDLVVVTETGHEVLTGYTKELVTVG